MGVDLGQRINEAMVGWSPGLAAHLIELPQAGGIAYIGEFLLLALGLEGAQEFQIVAEGAAEALLVDAEGGEHLDGALHGVGGGCGVGGVHFQGIDRGDFGGDGVETPLVVGEALDQLLLEDLGRLELGDEIIAELAVNGELLI
jgi:hypothetical protein